ncbi:hypothetical protein U472_07525 [Orenia metallireducens]|uniref:Hemerythrin-like domain-containing protein n=1 Tax=Orenia metallireducens TaxID=1413210 RepID=A0A1C0AAV8_9FIRM|nr:hypothetical protein U472_07525 [Orenia metallireducens]
MAIKWKDDLLIGVEEIDQQHKEIFKRSNYFLNFLNNNEKEDKNTIIDEMENLFYFLTDYFVTHFSSEERLQEEYNYPDYEKHQFIHKNFIDKITELKFDFINENEDIHSLAVKLKEEVLVWLVEHINKEDKKVGEYINSSIEE